MRSSARNDLCSNFLHLRCRFFDHGLFLLIWSNFLDNLCFLSALLFSELFVINQITILILIYWFVIKDRLFFENILQRLNDFVEILTVFIVLFILIEHNVTRRNGENANQLA